jgi:N-acetylglucosamine-6-phosphate deacetylase
MASQAGPERRLQGSFVYGSRVVSGAITIRGGRISGLVIDPASEPAGDPGIHPATTRQASPGSAPPGPRPETVREDVEAPFVIGPGFIDVHVHGGGGLSAMGGPLELDRLATVLATRGTTAFLPTSVSAPPPELVQFAADVRAARIEQEARRTDPQPLPTDSRARILGANLEGPAIDPAHRGAHDPASIVNPGKLLAAWRANPEDWTEVRIVTLAPERPGGLELIGHLAELGIVASVGHTGATFEEARSAFLAGARSTTHLLNAMTGVAARAPGVAGAALAQPGVTVELIADGLHVDPGLWPVLWKVLGRRLLLVSDAMPAAGLGDGTYRLGSMPVSVAGGRATTESGSLAGSTISLADAVVNLVAAGLPLPRAVAAATLTPARLLGRPDLGRIGVGARADLVVLDPAGRVDRTMIDGEWLASTAG